jgi:hypothetical protein
MFEFANSLFDAGSTFVEQFWKEGRYDFAVLDIFNTTNGSRILQRISFVPFLGGKEACKL